MKGPISIIAVLAVFWITAAQAQQPIEMRPDEAFWNAIRDGSSADAVELFLKAHPDSPYAAEATKKLQGLRGAAPTPALASPAKPAAEAPPSKVSGSPPADIAATENAEVEAISFLGVLGLSLRDEAGALQVTKVAPGSELAGSVLPGDRFIAASGKRFTDLTSLADSLTFLSFGMKPIEFELLRAGLPIKVTGSNTLTDRLQLALKGL